MTGDPRHALGRDAEQRVRRWLEAKGLSLLHQNWRGRHGELDLVMRHGRILVIVEVRARPGRTHLDAYHSIGPAKCRRLSATVGEYLWRNAVDEAVPVRVDFVTVAGPVRRPTVHWWRDAVRLGSLY